MSGRVTTGRSRFSFPSHASAVEHGDEILEAELGELLLAGGAGLRVPAGFLEKLDLERLRVDVDALQRAGRLRPLTLAGDAVWDGAAAGVAALAHLEGHAHVADALAG